MTKFFKSVFSWLIPKKTEKTTNNKPLTTLTPEDDFVISFDDITLDIGKDFKPEPKLQPNQKKPGKQVTLSLKSKDITTISRQTALSMTSPDTKKRCIAVFECSGKHQTLYFRMENVKISMTEFKRKARRAYADINKCEYIDTRAVALDTHQKRHNNNEQR